MSGNANLYRFISFETIFQIVTLLLLGGYLRESQQTELLLQFVYLISAAIGLRIIVATAIFLFTDESAEFADRKALSAAFIVNLTNGLAWGLASLLLTQGLASGHSFYLILPLALAGLSIVNLAGSALQTSLYLAFSIPLLGIPIAWFAWFGHYPTAAMIGFLLVAIVMLARSTQLLGVSLHRYRKISHGNSELYKQLAESRDDALRNQRDAEVANQALTEEVKERERAEARIKASEQELNQILEDMIDIYFRVDTQGKIIRISPSVQYILGWVPRELIGKPFNELFLDQSGLETIQGTLSGFVGIVENIEIQLRHFDGRSVWVSLNAHEFKTLDGKKGGFEGVARDITESRQAAEALFTEKERLHITLESIADGVITTNVQGQVEYINVVGEKMTGWTSEEAEHTPLPLENVLCLINEDSGQPVALPMEAWLVKGERASPSEPALLRDREGHTKSAIELNGAPIRDSKNQVIGSVLVFHDVTKLRNLTKQLAHQATHDSLTGLINRIEFDHRVETAIRSAANHKAEHALCYLDLDQFKIVNDTAGHHAGDELLKQLTALLLAGLREADTLARLGGDEFGILLSGCPLHRAKEIAEKLRAIVEKYRLNWEGKPYSVGASIGLVPITEHTEGLTELLSAADSACYVAKEQGRNRVHVYTPDDEAVAQQQGQMQWMQRIKNALENDLFELHFQPIESLKETKDIKNGAHGELLVRMLEVQDDHSHKLIPPNAFIPAAERYHLMPQIDRWVIRTAFAIIAETNNSPSRLGLCAINLSGQSLTDLTLYEFILQRLKETGIAPQQLCFEITESAVVANIEVAREFITRLRKIGCKFALDDFGSGLSSFEYLKNLPVDFVKLDGSLVKDIANNKIDLAMVRAINYITHTMGMYSIAEYVETQDTITALNSISVDFAQGYWIGKPAAIGRAVNKKTISPVEASTV